MRIEEDKLVVEKIQDVFDKIKKVSSRTLKEGLLKANEKDEDFRFVLEFLYNPFKMTGIKTKKMVKFSSFKSDKVHQINDIREAINYLLENNTGKDEDAMVINNYINQHTGAEGHDFLQDVLTKTYKCGITASTINKVYGKNTIPKFDVMLAKKYEDEVHKLKGDFGVTLKLDGIRCVAMKKRGKVTFFTRTGQPILEMTQLVQAIERIDIDNFVLDGELLLENDNNLPSDELFRATQKVARKDGEKFGLEFHIFDNIPLEEFLDGKSKKTYVERMNDLDIIFNQISEESYLKQVPMLYWGNDKSLLSKLLEEVIMLGKEGLMVSKANGYYVTKRSDNLLKVKKMHDFDLEIIGFEQGLGKNEDTLGAIIVNYKSNKVKVGSGFSDEDRDYIWGNRDSVLGKIATIQYFEESRNQDDDLISLRFPVFKAIRFDKDTSDD